MLRTTFYLVAATVFAANAQTINLQGVVSNTSGKPISGAVVSLVRQNLKDTTSADGKYSFMSTSVKDLPAIVPQSNDISLKNNVVQFTLSTQSPMKIEVIDLKGNLLWQEVNMNAAAGMYRFDISKTCQTAKVLVVKASIGRSEVSFRSMAIKGGQYALTPLTTTSEISRNCAMKSVAAVVDTIKVTATGYFAKSVTITSFDNQQQNITLDSNDVKEWPTANPAAAGPFEVAADKDVGPLAGIADDPVYGKQKRFNVYRPKNIASSGYQHPILIWANGYKDNPEPNPPCEINRADKWCGQYLPILQHLASHGFVVVASLSTATGSGDPLPTIVGMDWIIKQNEDQSSPYYHHLDTSKIGQLGHSFGGMSTCMSAADPRYKALATICGTRELKGVHTPMMFFCGGKDGTVPCSGVKDVFLSVKNQPAFFINELNADHGSWVYQQANGVSLSAAAAWFRIFLMNDTANRKYFYGSNCTFCSDSRVNVEQNSLMKQ
ncbi:MAG TPA: hypothetical protein VHO70_08950 [Chitinispirillaceae bacterium]|nr:hypothetical protein [Chitinispirillaceae bacterium]